MLKILSKARPRGGHLDDLFESTKGPAISISSKTAVWLSFVGCLIGLFSSGCGNVANEGFYQTVQGPAVASSRIEGKWQVINYWATWCGPCITEVPELNDLAHGYSERLIVLGVDYDAPSEAEEAMASIEKMGIQFPVLSLDPATSLGIEPPTILPTTILVNPNGKVREVLVGPQTSASLLARLNSDDSGAG